MSNFVISHCATAILSGFVYAIFFSLLHVLELCTPSKVSRLEKCKFPRFPPRLIDNYQEVKIYNFFISPISPCRNVIRRPDAGFGVDPLYASRITYDTDYKFAFEFIYLSTRDFGVNPFDGGATVFYSKQSSVYSVSA